ncbi:MAG: ABC transporter ATP-binding protein [Chloroflexi bacterium]|nr:ABC transporter ATP-binding protein [Chloroflexota bacterium]
MLEIRGLAKSFLRKGQPFPVLDRVDLCAREGETVGVVGPSGCGKTTLLNIVAGLEQPDKGSVVVSGLEGGQRLGRIAYMQQKDLLLPWRTVLGNSILGLELQGASLQEARKRAQELLESFGLKGFEGYYPEALSGGMRQRVAFLRTVLAGGPLILLDEPFGSLDAYTRASMQEWLLKALSPLGKTVLLVTHDVEEALLLSDRVYVLTPRPACVKAEVPVSLPRPRSRQLVLDPAFIELRAALLKELWQGALSYQPS